jgi:hypothetical protein
MTEFETWLYRGIIAVALIVIWYFLSRLLTEIQEMNANIKLIGEKGLVHDGKLELVDNKVTQHESRLNDHTNRLRCVERKQDSCSYCKEA